MATANCNVGGSDQLERLIGDGITFPGPIIPTVSGLGPGTCRLVLTHGSLPPYPHNFSFGVEGVRFKATNNGPNAYQTGITHRRDRSPVLMLDML